MYYSIVHTYHIHGSDTYIHVYARWVGFQMPATFHYMHVMGHVMDVITCITWSQWSLPLQSHYIQDVIHVTVITCPLHAPKDANEYSRYYVTCDIVTVGVTYDVVVTDLRYRR